MSGSEARPGLRALAVTALGLAGAAGLLWGGSVAVWSETTPAAGAPQAAPVALTGAQTAPWLGGVALLALAGVAGVVATGGPLRRLVGVLLAVAGLGVLAASAAAMVQDPYGSDAPASALPQPSGGVSVEALRHQPAEHTPAPLLPIAGGVLLVAVGGFVAVRERRLARFGARYAAPGRAVPQDPDRAAWQALDAGRDPTAPESSQDPSQGSSQGSSQPADPDAERGSEVWDNAGNDPDDGPRNAAV